MASKREILRGQIYALAKAGLGTKAICEQLSVSKKSVIKWKNRDDFKDKKREKRKQNTIDFNCKYCDKTFTRRGPLNRHVKFHENKRQYKCNHNGCDKAFNTQHCLKKHQLVHLENKLFKCDYCDLQTNRKENLKDHIRIKHTKEGLFKCKWPGCDKEFTKRNLYLHMTKTHSKVKVKCNIPNCNEFGKEFTKKDLMDHIMKAHGIVNWEK